jgi:uncharacterized protein (TIGR02231 family)
MGSWLPFACAPHGVLPLILLAATAPPRGGEATPVATRITEVSVHPGSALVTRHGVVPEGSARVVVADLPGTTLPDSVRLKLDGGEANGIEVRPVRRATLPDERLAALERRRDELVRAQESAADRLALETALRARLEGLLDQEAALHAREVAGGRANATAWSENFAWLDAQLRAARQSERAARWALESAKADVEAAGAELGRLEPVGAPQTFTVAFDVVALRQGALDLEVDYLVSGASWSPRYDLRADRDLKQVDLVYRAEVSQQSGEDWKEVDLLLSTAEPRRGVCGPKAKPLWLSLARPQLQGRFKEGERRLEALGYLAGDKEKADEWKASREAGSFAAVENEGLSVRFHLGRKETIESRPGSSTVLVGRAALAVTGERVTTPALDLGVWLRGRTRNTSDYLLLPGPTAVFFGNDFVGPSALTLVRPGQEFTLDLGLDAGLKVERIHVTDETGSTGFFRSKRQKIDRWRILLENHGALAFGDGRVTVQVREILPKVKDDRIEVELGDCRPALATGGRFDRDREERGLLTWELPVANGDTAVVDWQTRIVWPEDRELVTQRGAVVPFVDGPAGVLLLGLLAAGGALALLRRRRRGTRLPLVVAALGAMGFARSASGQQPAESRIERVTVWGAGARVERIATLPGAGSYLIRGLPASADPASIRVRIDGGEVVGVKVRERRERSLPDERLDALRTTIAKLAREKQELEDERATLQSLAAHLAKLLVPSTGPTPGPAPLATPGVPAGPSAPPDEGRPGARVWAADRDFLAARLEDQQKAARANERALADKERELETARQSLKSGEAASVVLRDVAIDVVAAAGGALECELSYLVDAAGWAPTYELRARKELTSVALTYRARVWQTTAESWDGVDLWLSSAQPRRGAAGPDPQAQWLTLRSETPAAGMAAPTATTVARGEDFAAELEQAKAPAAAPRPPPFAAVADEGLSVRFHLPDRATIAPGEEGKVVLVGRADLPLQPDRFCVPALDATVWLEAKATNSSEWTLLPGETAVHLGNDYLGKGTLALTRKGQEFDLALGADPNVSVERVALEDQRRSSALSSKGTQSFTWRLELENHGAPSTARDGAITVRVQEALPRSRDERITVRLESARPEPSASKEDQKLRDDSSILTWRVVLPRDGKSEIEWRWSARFPERERLATTGEE